MTKPLVQELLEARHRDFTPSVLQVIDDACNKGLQPTDLEVCERVLATIKELNQPSFRGSRPLTCDDMARRIEEALKFETQLQSLNEAELQEMYRENRKSQREARQKRASGHDNMNFGHPKHQPDFDVWNRRLIWSVRESIYLSLDKDPDTTNFETEDTLASVLRAEYELRKKAVLSMTGLSLESTKPISFFTAWFIENELTVPAGFGAAKSSIAPTNATIQELQAEIRILKEKLEKTRPEVDRSFKMNAMIYCIAVGKFRYDASKKQNPAVANIEACTVEVASLKGDNALRLSNNTVRDILNEAAERVSQE